jgi:hypothetical protein
MYKEEATAVFRTIAGHHTIASPSVGVRSDANSKIIAYPKAEEGDTFFRFLH